MTAKVLREKIWQHIYVVKNFGKNSGKFFGVKNFVKNFGKYFGKNFGKNKKEELQHTSKVY